MLRKTASDFKECLAFIDEHAISESPGECCGIVLGLGPINAHSSVPLEVFLCTNIQNAMHEGDPVTYKRDSTTAYLIDPAEQAEVFRTARTEGLDIVAFYHCHVGHGVYFSDEDRLMASWDGDPTYPEAAYIIVSVNAGRAGEAGPSSGTMSSRSSRR